MIQEDPDAQIFTKEKLIELGKQWSENPHKGNQVETGKINSPTSGCYMYEVASYFNQIRDDTYEKQSELKNSIYGLMSLGYKFQDDSNDRVFLMLLKNGLQYEEQDTQSDSEE